MRPQAETPERKRHTGRPWLRLRARVIESETHCGVCGKHVDKTLQYPHPGSPSVDCIIPLSKGGSSTDRNNLRLTHLFCNVSRGNRIEKRRLKRW